MSGPRLHLRDPMLGDRWHVSWCGQRRGNPDLLVDDPADATCQTCLTRLASDMDTRPQVPSYVRTRAYGRALCYLRDRHRDEFDQMMPEVVAEVLREEWDDIPDGFTGGCATPDEFLRAIGAPA